MKVQLKVLTGTRAGHVVVFSRQLIAVGRHSSSDLQFDPERDMAVSGRHATIASKGPRWFVRDEGSLNGTLVNGHRITADTALDDTDQIRFGSDGPLVEFRLVHDGTPDGVVQSTPAGEALKPPHAAPAPAAEGASARSAAPQPSPRRPESTTQRIRVEVGRRTRRLRALTIVLFAVLLGVVAVFLVETNRQRRVREAEIAAAEARMDSIVRAATEAIRALQGQVEGLDAALRSSQTEVGRLRSDLAVAQQSGSVEQVRDLERQLADATQALLYRQAAAYVDYAGILETNQTAVALVWSDLGAAGGGVHTGTAFAVRSDGTMLTARHVVAGDDGTLRPTRLAIKFADSYQIYPAELLAVSPDADVAAIRVSVPGGVPVVRGLNARADTVRQGDPVAIVGFPLGTELPMSQAGDSRTIARATFTAGSVSKSLADVIQIDGYGAQGASGSPIFDRTGEVVAILFGGEPGSEGRIVLAVPASHAIRLLASLR